jgi:hypothetical protein
MEQEKKPCTEKGPFRWRWHVFLVTVLVFEGVAAIGFHRSEGDLLISLEEERDCEQVQALFVLTNRNEPMEVDEETIQRLIDMGNPRLREWIMSANFSRFVTPEFKQAYIESLGDSEEAFRYQFLETHQVGKRSSMSLADLDRFLRERDR